MRFLEIVKELELIADTDDFRDLEITSIQIEGTDGTYEYFWDKDSILGE